MVHSPAPKRVPNVSPTGSYWHVYVWHMSFIHLCIWWWFAFRSFFGMTILRISTYTMILQIAKAPFSVQISTSARLSQRSFTASAWKPSTAATTGVSPSWPLRFPHDFPMPYTIPKSSPLYSINHPQMMIGLSLGSPWLNVLKMLLRSSNWIFIILHGLLRQKPCMVKAACHLFETYFFLKPCYLSYFRSRDVEEVQWFPATHPNDSPNNRHLRTALLCAFTLASQTTKCIKMKPLAIQSGDISQSVFKWIIMRIAPSIVWKCCTMKCPERVLKGLPWSPMKREVHSASLPATCGMIIFRPSCLPLQQKQDDGASNIIILGNSDCTAGRSDKKWSCDQVIRSDLWQISNIP